MKKLNDHELKEWLSEFDIEYPDEEKIDQTIMLLHQYVPKKKQTWFTRHIPAPLKNAFQESLHFSKTFWITNLTYLAIGLCFVLLANKDPYMTLFYFAPLPVLISLIDIFRSRDAGMIELELSLKYAPADLILSKLAIVGIFNLVCNLFLILVFNLFAEPIVLNDLLKYWAVPYLTTIALCLFLSIKFRLVFAAPISIAILFAFGMTIVQFEAIYQALPSQLMIAVLLGAITLIGLETNMIKKGVYHEFNH